VSVLVDDLMWGRVRVSVLVYLLLFELTHLGLVLEELDCCYLEEDA